MFRIVCDPSSGTLDMYLTEIIRSGSQMFVVCLVDVWQRKFEPMVCAYGPTGWKLVVPSPSDRTRYQTPTKHMTYICEPIISVKYSSILPYDGSHTIRNMLE